MSFRDIKVGDKVRRWIGGTVEDIQIVTEVKENTLVCGGPYGWTYDRDTGGEEDEDMKWGKAYGVTGSWIKHFDPIEEEE